jgi:hypothetical protein
LADFFSAYNFTIDENDPDDSEVGIDPEMLGHIFENLLEDNKDKGAFYTPKEIVHYMCRESLVQYLRSHTGDELHEAIDKLVRYGLADSFAKNRPAAVIIDNLLREVKICDPAIGSGAFPMGLLSEVFRCRRLLYGHLKTGEPFSPSKIKREIIQNNIYGVDIEQGAVDIARLRFWLSLVVDEPQPEPLPNLDYKIMQGNSLLESFEGEDLSVLYKEDEPVGDLFSAPKKRQDIIELQSRYFSTTDHIEKSRIKSEINEIIVKHLENSLRQNKRVINKKLDETRQTIANFQAGVDGGGIPKGRIADYQKRIDKETRMLSQLETAKASLDDKSARLKAIDGENRPFFLWHLFFKDVLDKGGFDIIIGNPPYIQLQANGGELAKIFGPQKDGKKIIPSPYQTFDNMGDIYSLFYERGVMLLKQWGILCYITSNKWMRTAYGEKTRKFFVEQTNPIILVDLGAGIFESATVETNILLLSKSVNAHRTLAGKGLDASFYVCDFGTDSWVVLSPIEQSIKAKVEAVGIPLKEWDIKINFGVKTGYNEAFIIDGAKRAELIAADPKSAEIIRPILRGRDIKRYNYDFADLWLINTHNGIKEKSIKPINIYDYPAVKKHLDGYWIQIEKRADQGDTPYNLRNCAYIEDFSKQKIVWKRIGSILRFCFDNDNHVVLDSTCFATGKHIEYLTAILNSELGNYMLQDSPKTGTGDLLISVQAIEPIKIPIPDDEIESRITTLLYEENYHEIDRIVYGIYNLSCEEIEFIELQ